MKNQVGDMGSTSGVGFQVPAFEQKLSEDRGGVKYHRLSNTEQTNQHFMDDALHQQQLILESQDNQLDQIGNSVGVLKHISHHIGSELDEQNVMLDEFRQEMDHTETRLDGTMKKIAKMMHMSSDRRQWCAILTLLLILLIVVVLFFVL